MELTQNITIYTMNPNLQRFCKSGFGGDKLDTLFVFASKLLQLSTMPGRFLTGQYALAN